ncbi:MAG: aminopeptidase P N-terminal domain-containing protein [Planctomycetota bacterium]
MAGRLLTTELPKLIARCAQRRRALLDRLGDGLLIVPTAREMLRNGDVLHTFRAGSDLYWLTGFTEPESTLCAWREGRRVRTVLFVRPRDKEREIWDGRRHGVEGAVAHYGVDEAVPIGEFWTRIAELLRPHARVFVRLGRDADFDRRLFATFGALSRERARSRANLPAHPILQDPSPDLAELRLFKDPLEIAAMQRAADISAAGHVAAMRASHAGVTEFELQSVLEQEFRRAGSERNGYDSIVAGGANACILHYHENARRVHRNELVLIDAGCEVDAYTADITRTFPVDGDFTPAQRAVYQAVLRAQLAAIRAIRPKVAADRPHLIAQRELTKSLVALKVLRGDPKKLFAKEAFKPFYMHGTSHWLGLDVHDCGRYQDLKARARAFEPGMVLTVEPGLYFDPHDKAVPAALRGIGVRIEDDVLVTRQGHRVLTAACPKTVADLRAVQGAAERA